MTKYTVDDFANIFPETIEKIDEKFYFIDRTIYGSALAVQYALYQFHCDPTDESRDFHLGTFHVYPEKRGIITVSDSFSLSDKTCIELFKNNIGIKYYKVDCDDNGNFDIRGIEEIHYDQLSITRRYTIKNIIEHECSP